MLHKQHHTAREAVEEMIAAGSRFDDIEEYIEQRGDLTADGKSALWLLAWAETDREARRQAVDALLQADSR